MRDIYKHRIPKEKTDLELRLEKINKNSDTPEFCKPKNSGIGYPISKARDGEILSLVEVEYKPTKYFTR